MEEEKNAEIQRAKIKNNAMGFHRGKEIDISDMNIAYDNNRKVMKVVKVNFERLD